MLEFMLDEVEVEPQPLSGNSQQRLDNESSRVNRPESRRNSTSSKIHGGGQTATMSVWDDLLAADKENRTQLLALFRDGIKRPPWHVPHRMVYPVPSEAERRRVGAVLSTQILRRSTFLFYYSAEQCYRICQWFPTGNRADAAISLYARCIDLENFYLIQRLLTPSEIHVLKRKLGALAVMNPYMPDGPYSLDLSLHDERKVALMLVWLAAGEPGENWQNETFQHPGQEPRKLDVTTAWTTDEGMPEKGVMSLTYVTNRHCAIPALRNRLAAQTLIGSGHDQLIPEDMRRPATPPWLRNKRAQPKKDVSELSAKELRSM